MWRNPLKGKLLNSSIFFSEDTGYFSSKLALLLTHVSSLPPLPSVVVETNTKEKRGGLVGRKTFDLEMRCSVRLPSILPPFYYDFLPTIFCPAEYSLLLLPFPY